MLAIVAPGQGAQTPGFLSPWLRESSFSRRLEWLSAAAGLDLVHFGTEADKETIRDTAVAQPLLVVAGLLAAAELFPSPADAFPIIGVGAGHSVGEITAAAGAGVLTAEQAMILVRERGKAMAAASAATPTSMTAMVGGNLEEVLAAIERHGLTAANNNGTGQIVAAGTVEQLAALAADAPRRCRLVPLSVAGAFHTHHMAPAVDHLASLAASVTTGDPRIRLLSNADGWVVQSGDEFLQRIVAQVASPVRWDLCIGTMADLGVTGLLELPPAGTLTGIAKRNLKGVELFALNTPDDLPEAFEFVRKHGERSTPTDLTGTSSFRLVVSPAKGSFIRIDGVDIDSVLPPLSKIGTVTTLRDETPVSAPHGGVVTEWLVENGDPVGPGQPLLRLYPTIENESATEVTR